MDNHNLEKQNPCTVISFYKYIEIKQPDKLVETIRSYCTKNNILGRILVSNEGINGAICSVNEDIERFKIWIKKNALFSDLTFREQHLEHNSYHKLVVRLREEMVFFGKKVDLAMTGKHLPPKELKKMLDDGEEIILLDARNDYDHKVGKFKGAVTLPIHSFREFPESITRIAQLNKVKKINEKKIVMYCTGGVRCEKASAYLKEKGFTNVYQIEGGIINYVNQFPDTYFEGSCLE